LNLFEDIRDDQMFPVVVSEKFCKNQMAWGVWNKIKNGIKKAVGGVGSAVSWVNDRIVKPVVKPLVNAVAPVLDGFVPGLGSGIRAGLNYGSGFADNLAPKLKTFGGGGRRIEYI
jgi:phage-related protein